MDKGKRRQINQEGPAAYKRWRNGQKIETVGFINIHDESSFCRQCQLPASYFFEDFLNAPSRNHN
jgi:molybdenum cofactor biosynthesis enzyme MoaA